MKTSQVVFNAENHTYTAPDGKRLSGITGIIGKHLFPNKYSNVSDILLAEKAEYGHMVHEQIRDWFVIGVYPTTPEARSVSVCYSDMLSCEFIVNDDNFATAIDAIDKEYNLYDWKTTYQLDKEYLSWQLSICAYLFEQQTGLKAGKLFGVHLRGNSLEEVEVERKPIEAILGLFEAELSGNIYNVPTTGYNATLGLISSLERQIATIEAEAKQAKERRDELLKGIEEKMIEAGVKKWETETMTITRVLPTTKKAFDKKVFESEHPELAGKYDKESPVKGSIRLTLK